MYQNYYIFNTLLKKVDGCSVHSVLDKKGVKKRSERSEMLKTKRDWAEIKFL